jgi:ATP-dependent DNA helicase RecG
MYEDRMEIVNSGGLYGRITIDSLGKVRPDTRNSTLANILELLSVTENRYSGIPTIRKELQSAGLPPPIFVVRRGEFSVTFKNGHFDETTEDKGREEAVLAFCQSPRSRDEISRFTGFSQYYTMSRIIKPMVDQGLLRMTIPDKPKSKHQKFVTVA